MKSEKKRQVLVISPPPSLQSKQMDTKARIKKGEILIDLGKGRQGEGGREGRREGRREGGKDIP